MRLQTGAAALRFDEMKIQQKQCAPNADGWVNEGNDAC